MTKIIDYLINSGYIYEKEGKICHKNKITRRQMGNTDKRIERLKEFHDSHPGIKTRKEFVCFVPETDYMVDKFFKKMGWS